MSDNSEEPRQCGLDADELSELALGILSGRRRSEVLTHVESCGRCSAELVQLAFVADSLLLLAPQSEPPLGFEQRLDKRRQLSAVVRQPRRFRRIGVHSAVAVCLVVLGVGFGDLILGHNTNDQGESTTATLTSAMLTSHTQVLGEVFIARGRPEWIFISIDNSSWSGVVTCEVTLAGGRVETVGTFNHSARYRAWGAPLTSAVAKVVTAQLIAPGGTVLAIAIFPR